MSLHLEQSGKAGRDAIFEPWIQVFEVLTLRYKIIQPRLSIWVNNLCRNERWAPCRLFSLVINTSAIHFCLRALSLPLLPSQPLLDLSKQWHLQDYFLKITFLGLSSLRLGPSCTMTPLQSGNKKAHIKQKEEAPVSGSSARHQINVFFNTLESGNYLTHQRAWCE